MIQRKGGRTIQVLGCKNTAVLQPKFLPISSTTTSCGEGKIATIEAEHFDLCRAAGRRSSGRMRAISSIHTLNIAAVLVLEFARAEYP
jgi:hypothetical protein